MKRKKRWILGCILTILMCNVMIIPVYGKDVTTCSGIYSYSTNDNEQWRFIYVVKDPQWTPLKVEPGQPTNGTYVEKGNFLFYGESGGESVTISFGVSLGPQYANASANVGISIPLGTVSYLGQGFKAKKSGRYLIKVKKEVQPTITFIQYRRKVNNCWSEWGKPQVYSTRYELKTVHASMVLQ